MALWTSSGRTCLVSNLSSSPFSYNFSFAPLWAMNFDLNPTEFQPQFEFLRSVVYIAVQGKPILLTENGVWAEVG